LRWTITGTDAIALALPVIAAHDHAEAWSNLDKLESVNPTDGIKYPFGGVVTRVNHCDRSDTVPDLS
jgi:hypothetical protein